MSRTEAQKKADRKYRENRKRITLDLHPDIYFYLDDLAEMNNCSVTAVIKTAIAELIFRVEDKEDDQ